MIILKKSNPNSVLIYFYEGSDLHKALLSLSNDNMLKVKVGVDCFNKPVCKERHVNILQMVFCQESKLFLAEILIDYEKGDEKYHSPIVHEVQSNNTSIDADKTCATCAWLRWNFMSQEYCCTKKQYFMTDTDLNKSCFDYERKEKKEDD